MFEAMGRYHLKNGCLTNAEYQTIVCTTNCVGAMGRGIALTFRELYPHVYREYRKRWRKGLLEPNYLFTVPLNDKQQVLMFPTKIDWKKPSPDGLIYDNLRVLEEQLDDLGIDSMALPPLGLANGWVRDRAKVYLAMYEVLGRLPIRCTLYY